MRCLPDNLSINLIIYYSILIQCPHPLLAVLLDLPFLSPFGMGFASQFSELRFTLESISYAWKWGVSATLVSPVVGDDKPDGTGPP